MKRWLFLWIILSMFFITMCVPGSSGPDDSSAAEQAKLDSLRQRNCPRWMSSATEYYNNKNYKDAVNMYSEILELGCDEYDPSVASPKEIYLYYAYAHENLREFEEEEKVSLKGLQKLPNDIKLRERLAYSYERQRKMDMYFIEMERIIEVDSTNVENMLKLSKAYKKNKRFEDQIYILNKVLNIEPNNQEAIADIRMAYIETGEDALKFDKILFEQNQDNTSYGNNYADALIIAERLDEAAGVLNKVIQVDRNNSLAYDKLAKVYYKMDDLESSADIYTKLHNEKPRDEKVTIKLSDIYVELGLFDKAMKWAKKAQKISPSGETISQIGLVYYEGFQYCHQSVPTDDDKIVATLALREFKKASKKGYKKHNSKIEYLENPKYETLFTGEDWFLLDVAEKARGYAKPKSKCYDWVDDVLMKSPDWSG